ncbi:hypothetical protein GCM10023115_37480 [Pontixanthobacter gangjinensis]|uniref:DUF2178 domain-containing protein n=1 Tax=Christiangramia aestuarii TaxID=1028746 RepID=A0A7K1LQK0_9FLAO|nr:hypothetical protein [Christiangramia aestuarii]MUP43085.1 hypothetical protein [Christiangramia aestuarii]
MKKIEENWECNSRKSNLNLALWTGAWVISMAIASFGPKFIWNENESISIIAILINLGFGIALILANRKHLNGLDELQRKIQLEAMGISLGVAVIFGLSYSMLDTTNLISYDAEISHLVILISLTYLGGIIIGNLRYR